MNGVSAIRDGGILRLTLDRPDKRNAVDTPLLSELLSRLHDATEDDSVRAVLLTGAGRAFCSGGDLTGGNTQGAVLAANEVILAITRLPRQRSGGLVRCGWH